MSQNAVSYETLFEFGENAEQNSIIRYTRLLKIRLTQLIARLALMLSMDYDIFLQTSKHIVIAGLFTLVSCVIAQFLPFLQGITHRNRRVLSFIGTRYYYHRFKYR